MTRTASFAALALALVACGSGTSPPAKPTGGTGTKISAANVPTSADEVIEASIAAQGGRDKLATLTAIKSTASVLIPQANIRGTVVIYNAPPRESLQELDIAGIGKSRSGTHDGMAWEMNPLTGARIIDGPEKRLVLRDATFNSDLHWKELFPKAELAGVVDFGGAPSYKVVLTTPEGDQLTRYYAKDTFLPVGYEEVVKSQMGEVAVALVESDYRDVGGLKFPFKASRKDATVAAEITIETIELSPALDPKLFEIPQEIKALQGVKAPSPASAPPAAPVSR
jgi:hypothetical protein